MKMLAGFRSRCIILFWCICCRAMAIWCVYSKTRFSVIGTSSSMCRFITSFKSPFSAHSTAIKSSFNLASMNQLKYFMIFGWSRDWSEQKTYLVQLDLLEAVLPLTLVVHVENLKWAVRLLLSTWEPPVCFRQLLSPWTRRRTFPGLQLEEPKLPISFPI